MEWIMSEVEMVSGFGSVRLGTLALAYLLNIQHIVVSAAACTVVLHHLCSTSTFCVEICDPHPALALPYLTNLYLHPCLYLLKPVPAAMGSTVCKYSLGWFSTTWRLQIIPTLIKYNTGGCNNSSNEAAIDNN